MKHKRTQCTRHVEHKSIGARNLAESLENDVAIKPQRFTAFNLSCLDKDILTSSFSFFHLRFFYTYLFWL